MSGSMKDAFGKAAAAGTRGDKDQAPALRVPVCKEAADPGTVFIRDMLTTASDLRSRDEAGQAFDQLTRAIEHLMDGYSGETDREQRVAFLQDAARVDACWVSFVDHRSSLARASGELRYYVAETNGPAADKLVRLGNRFQTAVESGDREQAASLFADWVGSLRGGRVHGDPAFSGRNIRVVYEMETVLDLLTAVVQMQQSRTAQSGNHQ